MPTLRYELNTGDVAELAFTLDEILGGAWAPKRSAMVEATLTFAYHGGYALVAGVPTLIPDGTIVCTDDAVSYVQRDREGVVSMSTTYDPLLLPMAEVTCAAGLLTYFQDIRDLVLSHPAPTGGGGGTGHGGEFDAGQFAALTWVNQDAATAALDADGFVVMSLDNASELKGMVQAITAPTGDWKVRCRVSLGSLADTGRGAGLILREAATDKSILICLFKGAGSPGEGVFAFRFASGVYVASLGTPINLRQDIILQFAMTLEIEKIGTQLYLRAVPGDGGVAIESHNETITASFTTGPDEFGIGGFSGGVSGVPTPAAFTYLEQV